MTTIHKACDLTLHALCQPHWEAKDYLPFPNNHYTIAQWKLVCKTFIKLLKRIRKPFYKNGKSLVIEDQSLTTLIVSNLNTSTEVTLTLDKEEDCLNWIEYLKGKKLGDTLSFTQAFPKLDFNHPLSAWSSSRRDLQITVKSIQKAPFKIFNFPNDHFNWNQAKELIPWACLNTIKSIPWLMIENLNGSIYDFKDSLEHLELNITEEILKQLQYQSELKIKYRNIIKDNLTLISGEHDPEAQCLFYDQLLRLSLQNRSKIQPEQQVTAIYSIILTQYEESIENLINKCHQLSESTDKTLALKEQKLSNSWCQNRQGVIQTQMKFFKQLAENSGVTNLFKKKDHDINFLFDKLKTSILNLNNYINKNSLNKNDVNKDDKEAYQLWIKNNQQHLLETDEIIIKKLRNKNISNNPQVTFQSFYLEKSSTLNDFFIEGELPNFKLKSIALSEQECLIELDSNLNQKIKTFIQAYGRMFSLEKQLKIILEKHPSLNESFHNLKYNIESFEFNIEARLHQKDILNLINKVPEKRDYRNKILKSDYKTLETQWAYLKNYLKFIFGQILDEIPDTGGLLQDFLCYNNVAESTTFKLPILIQHLQNYSYTLSIELERERQKLLALNAKKAQLPLKDLENFTDLSYGQQNLDTLIQTFIKIIVDQYWASYKEAVIHYSDTNIQNPNIKSSLKFFIRYGIPFIHKDIIPENCFFELLKSCQQSYKSTLLEDLGHGFILFPDELFDKVLLNQFPISGDFDYEVDLDQSQDLRNQDRYLRRKWRLKEIEQRLKHEITSIEEKLHKSLEKKLVKKSETSRKQLIELKNTLNEIKKRIIDLEENTDFPNESILQNKEYILNKETSFIRQQSNYLAESKNAYLPYQILKSVNLYGNKAFHNLDSIRLSLKNISNIDQDVFKLKVNSTISRVELTFFPSIVLIPGAGLIGNSVRSRSAIENGLITINMIPENKNSKVYDSIANASSKFRYDSDNEKGDSQDQSSFLGKYLFTRWKLLQKDSEARKKAAVNKDLSNRNNFSIHYLMYTCSEEGKRLKNKSKDLFEIFKQGLNK